LGTNDFVPVLSRSKDAGETWTQEGPLWPRLRSKLSIFGSVSRSSAGQLFFYGTRTPIDLPGEKFWSETTQGLKPNELFWARSDDAGATWTEPITIPMPIPGAAEAPGAMCITHTGRWLVCYSPYNTFDPDTVVDRGQVVILYSDDQGKSWTHTSMLRFQEEGSGAAEAWVIELTDGWLLGTCWHLDHANGKEYPNPYSLSFDRGTTWQSTQSTGIVGQSTGLACLPDGRALLVYNQRRHGKLGVWLAVGNPQNGQFGLIANEIIWTAETTTQSESSAEHSEWQDFAFGEPSVTVLSNNTLLVTLWCIQPSGRGVRYVKLRLIA